MIIMKPYNYYMVKQLASSRSRGGRAGLQERCGTTITFIHSFIHSFMYRKQHCSIAYENDGSLSVPLDLC